MTWYPDPDANPRDDAPLEAMLTRAAKGVDATPHVERVQPAIAAAWARSKADRAASGRADGALLTARRGLRLWHIERRRSRAHTVIRPVLAGAFALALATGSAAAATNPGAPLYATRLGIERALLPAQGSANRAAAELEYADRRLAEARQASERGDRGAVAVALGAFTEGIHDLADDGLGANADGLREHLAQDAAALAELRPRLDDAATTAALSTAEREIAALDGHVPHGGTRGRPIPAPRAVLPRAH